MKKILMVLGHPDDEVIFGWPLFFNPDFDKFLIVCSSDVNNPDRQWCKDRKKVMLKVARDNGVEAVCFDYDSEFYRIETRKEGLKNFCQAIVNQIRAQKFDAVFTHNPHGEYGHLDHKLIFNIIFEHMPLNVPLLFTDICQESNWPSEPTISHLSNILYYQDKVMDCVLDEAKAAAAEKEYRKAGCWTWDREIQKRCSVYRI